MVRNHEEAEDESMTTRKIDDPQEIRRLTILARRFASPCDTKDQLAMETCHFDLSWNLPPLDHAIAEVFGPDSLLRKRLLHADGNRGRTKRLWRYVERLPYGTVQRMIGIAQHRYWGPEWLLED